MMSLLKIFGLQVLRFWGTTFIWNILSSHARLDRSERWKGEMWIEFTRIVLFQVKIFMISCNKVISSQCLLKLGTFSTQPPLEPNIAEYLAIYMKYVLSNTQGHLPMYASCKYFRVLLSIVEIFRYEIACFSLIGISSKPQLLTKHVNFP